MAKAIHSDAHGNALYSGEVVQTYEDTDFKSTATTGAQADIAFVNSNPDTITMGSGSFITDGFTAGYTITVSGSASNDVASICLPPNAPTLPDITSNKCEIVILPGIL